MNYSVIFASKTGNTAILAEKIRETLKEEKCVHFGAPSEKAKEADVIFIGFWTDKGACSEDISAFLQTISEKKIFLFGTAGFGGAEEYFNQILDRVSAYLDKSNFIIGTFMCQGKMQISVRERYEIMEVEEPGKAEKLLENFDRALSHPDVNDLELLSSSIKNILYKK